MPTLFICVLIFAAWFTYERGKASKLKAKQSQAFWDREEEANHTRNKDISNLDYLYIEESQIPVIQENDSELQHLRSNILPCIQEKMIDLSSYSNTDLKLAFGVGRFAELSDYDTNYTNFIVSLSTYAANLMEKKYFQEANQCYLLLVEIGSQRPSDYYGLAETYLSLDMPNKLSSLITQVSSSDIPRKDKIVAQLKEIFASYQ